MRRKRAVGLGFTYLRNLSAHLVPISVNIHARIHGFIKVNSLQCGIIQLLL